jgi:AraC-like DNA-binding protein
MEPGEVHANTRPTPVSDFYVVLVEPAEFGKLAQLVRGDTKLAPVLLSPQLYVPNIEFKTNELIRELGRGDVASTQDALLELVNLLFVHGALEQKIRAPAFAGARAVRRAVELIQDCWDEPLRVTDLVRELGVPASTLSHAFRRKVGMGLRQYRKRVRLERSRRLLLTDKAPVADLAASCGFYDVSTYCREFKGLFGITPTQYRRLAL